MSTNNSLITLVSANNTLNTLGYHSRIGYSVKSIMNVLNEFPFWRWPITELEIDESKEKINWIESGF